MNDVQTYVVFKDFSFFGNAMPSHYVCTHEFVQLNYDLQP